MDVESEWYCKLLRIGRIIHQMSPRFPEVVEITASIGETVESCKMKLLVERQYFPGEMIGIGQIAVMGSEEACGRVAERGSDWHCVKVFLPGQ